MSRIECKQTSNGQYENVSEVERPDSGDSVPKMNTIGAVPNVDMMSHDSNDGYVDGEEVIGEHKNQ